MPWTWRYEKTDGAVVGPAGAAGGDLRSQVDAETGSARTGAPCSDAGVDQVTLLDDEKAE